MEKAYTCDGYKFVLLISHFGKSYILINQESETEDPKYIEALNTMKNMLPYFHAVGSIEDSGDMTDQPYPDGYYRNDPDVLMTIEAYEKDIIPVDDHVYQTAIALRDSIRPIKPPKPAKAARQKRKGYVYLVKSISGHYKIGRTIDPDNRAKTFGVKLPFEVEFMCLIKSDDYEVLELSLHAHFEKQRVNGEWFNLSDEDVEYVKSLAVTA